MLDFGSVIQTKDLNHDYFFAPNPTDLWNRTGALSGYLSGSRWLVSSSAFQALHFSHSHCCSRGGAAKELLASNADFACRCASLAKSSALVMYSDGAKRTNGRMCFVPGGRVVSYFTATEPTPTGNVDNCRWVSSTKAKNNLDTITVKGTTTTVRLACITSRCRWN